MGQRTHHQKMDFGEKMSIKEMDCFNCYPGDISYLTGIELNVLLRRDGKHPFFYNGIRLGGTGDNQRRTSYCYIYAGDNLLGGK